MTFGTPETIDQAIHDGMVKILTKGGTIQDIRMCLRDFLSQRFGASLLTENIEVSNAINQLWESIFPEEK